jgi:CheY-like chemotaxis protein
MTASYSSKPLVMVVDDFKMIRDTFGRILSDAGYNVVEAGCAEDCLKDAPILRPNLILMDMSMPGMGGIHAVLELRKNDATRETPVVFLTAHGNEIESAIPSSITFQGMLTKPCLPDELLSTIRDVLSSAQPLKTKIAGSPA